MNKANVKIINHNSDPARIVASSARISSTKGSATGIYDRSAEVDNSKLIEGVVKLGHVTTTEHAIFNIAFGDVSMRFEQFLIEFRLASYTIKSRRYVDYTEMGYLVPDFNVEDKNAFTEHYKEYCSMLFEQYEKLLELGVEKEDARAVLPYSIRSHIYATMNAREMAHFIVAGIDSGNLEIEMICEKLLEQAKEILPEVFNHLEAIEKKATNKTALLEALTHGYIAECVGRSENPFATVELLSFPSYPEHNIARAALIGHGGVTSDEADDILMADKRTTKRIIDVIMADARGKELEHASWTFRLSNVSLHTLTHITRHRMQSMTCPNFVGQDSIGTFCFPDVAYERDEVRDVYDKALDIQTTMTDLASDYFLSDEEYNYLLMSGNTVDIVITMNARQLTHFLRLRTCDRAQSEVRYYANNMLLQLRSVTDFLFSEVGPSCFMDGKCPEGRMCCGKQEEMKERWQ